MATSSRSGGSKDKDDDSWGKLASELLGIQMGAEDLNDFDLPDDDRPTAPATVPPAAVVAPASPEGRRDDQSHKSADLGPAPNTVALKDEEPNLSFDDDAGEPAPPKRGREGRADSRPSRAPERAEAPVRADRPQRPSAESEPVAEFAEPPKEKRGEVVEDIWDLLESWNFDEQPKDAGRVRNRDDRPSREPRSGRGRDRTEGRSEDQGRSRQREERVAPRDSNVSDEVGSGVTDKRASEPRSSAPREERPSSENRPGRRDREDRPVREAEAVPSERGSEEERPARRERPAREERSQEDRPAREDRPRRERSRDDRPPRSEQSREGSDEPRGERPGAERGERHRERSREDSTRAEHSRSPRPSEGKGPERKPVREEAARAPRQEAANNDDFGLGVEETSSGTARRPDREARGPRSGAGSTERSSKRPVPSRAADVDFGGSVFDLLDDQNDEEESLSAESEETTRVRDDEDRGEDDQPRRRRRRRRRGGRGRRAEGAVDEGAKPVGASRDDEGDLDEDSYEQREPAATKRDGSESIFEEIGSDDRDDDESAEGDADEAAPVADERDDRSRRRRRKRGQPRRRSSDGDSFGYDPRDANDMEARLDPADVAESTRRAPVVDEEPAVPVSYEGIPSWEEAISYLVRSREPQSNGSNGRGRGRGNPHRR